MNIKSIMNIYKEFNKITNQKHGLPLVNSGIFCPCQVQPLWPNSGINLSACFPSGKIWLINYHLGYPSPFTGSGIKVPDTTHNLHFSGEQLSNFGKSTTGKNPEYLKPPVSIPLKTQRGIFSLKFELKQVVLINIC